MLGLAFIFSLSYDCLLARFYSLFLFVCGDLARTIINEEKIWPGHSFFPRSGFLFPQLFWRHTKGKGKDICRQEIIELKRNKKLCISVHAHEVGHVSSYLYFCFI